MSLTSDERAEITAAMREVTRDGLAAAKHLTGDIYEVKADTNDKFFRALFAAEGQYGQVLLSLDGFVKKSNKTPKAKLDLAEKRLKSWRTSCAKTDRRRRRSPTDAEEATRR